MLLSPTFFWNKMARGYARSPVADQSAYEHKLAVTASHLKPTDRLLEFGCGTGTTALIHAPRVAHVDAIDFSSEMIAIAKEKAWDQSCRRVNFAVAAIEDWPIPDAGAAYDVVLGMSILHLVKDVNQTLTRVNQMLKSGGLFFSSTVCLGEMRGLGRVFWPALGHTGLIPKLHPFRIAQLKDHITAHGFRIETDWRPEKPGSVFLVARKVDECVEGA
ncbi:class I SAM-dependent methyltransferase [Cognatishimia sp. SS12]|uniref:class I SAM-dependent methyltransferase n=1 Tax=Cognatishimia sp. SS12 TaxID=2979465 RepID=UPI00232E35E1|nr:class I SAM-dependent methyltransferase [Cognatishimia sp. SS12]MDC0737435.1 class I SAM-dependent methyltransferase [Cognatishimia sp. SS12]